MHRLDALAARLLVELDRAEQVVEVGDRQRGLPVGGGGLDDFVDAVGAVDDGKLGVQAQVNEHASIVESARRAVPPGLHLGSLPPRVPALGGPAAA